MKDCREDITTVLQNSKEKPLLKMCSACIFAVPEIVDLSRNCFADNKKDKIRPDV